LFLKPRAGFQINICMNILSILKSKFDGIQLAGYHRGLISPDETRFCAYSLLDVSSEDYETLHCIFLANTGYGTRLQEADAEKTKKYNADGTFSSKPLDECIAENIFRYFTYVFTGLLYEGNWYLLTETIYHTDEKEAVIKYMDLHISARSGEYGAESLLKPFRPDKPNHPFGQLPWFVGYLKEEARTKLNRSYEAYTNENIFIPLVQFLREQDQLPYSFTTGLFSPRVFPLLYPHSKEKVMAIVKAQTTEEQSRLYYLLYLPGLNKIFEWTLPPVRPVPGFHAIYIMEDLASYCNWQDNYDLYDPHITMDDNRFWNEYVMKKNENGEFVFLKEISYINSQPDVYPDL
jgi:hypothetical protein